LLASPWLVPESTRTLRARHTPDVEIEPTEAMLEAGIDAYYAADFDPGSPFSLRETIERIYRAMRGASLATREGRAADAGS
jgi:hypothetical protein